jgi:ketosteroid isomerase-like protein
VHPNAELISGFYSAFAAGDHRTMGAAYSDRARFSDPVFPNLDADEARAMWRMFCTGGNDIAVTFGDVAADDRSGSARWEAVYDFPRTGRRVHNRIQAAFRFEDGRIVQHTDRFDLYRWTRMALGPVGALLGWTPIVRNKVRGQAAHQLARFREQDV